MQLTLDFSKPLPINDGKKTERLTIACSENFRKALNLISDSTGVYTYDSKGGSGITRMALCAREMVRRKMIEIIEY